MSHYNDAVDRCTKMYREEFEKHVLERISLDPPIFKMHRPDSGLYHMHICFVSGKIVLFGDAMVGYLGRGVISTPGYDLDWFTSKLDAGYLAEKFIARDWCEELAQDFLDEMLKEKDLGEEQRHALEWIKSGGDLCRDAFMREWAEHAEGGHGWPSESYNPAEISMLSVIQMRFRELYKELP